MIVESPSKCKKIEQYLRELFPENSWTCLATVGHFRKLKSISRQFQPTYDWDEKKRKHISSLQSMLSGLDPRFIYLATDDDREGEAIGWHFVTTMGWSIADIKRIVFHEITKDAIEYAVQNPRTLDMNWVVSQQTRQIMDRLVGYRVSPFLWKHVSSDNTLSAGRCQTPALRLIYEHAQEYKTIVQTPELYYKTRGLFFSHLRNGIYFTLNDHFTNEKEVHDFLQETKKVERYHMTLDTPTERMHKPPLPFQTSSLLQKVFHLLHWSSAKTMNVCQQLYQKGWITYMRTDSTQYAESFIVDAHQYIKSRFSEKEIGQTRGINRGGHEAIRVTDIREETCNNGEKDEQSLYHIIWKNTIESCMACGMDQTISVKLMPENWKYTIVSVQSLGWRILGTPRVSTASNELFFFQSLQPDRISPPSIIESIVSCKEHSLPHYSEASLIQKLVSLEIGRPSTYSSIIHTLFERNYVETKNIEGGTISGRDIVWNRSNVGGALEVNRTLKWGDETRKIVITDLGIRTLEFLMSGFFDLFSYEYTRRMEQSLDELRETAETSQQLCKDCAQQIKEGGKRITQSYAAISLDDEWMVCWSGPIPSLQHKITKEYATIAPDIIIDREKLARGEYSFSDICMKTELGERDGEMVRLKRGPFGLYIEWKDTKKPVPPSLAYRDIDLETAVALFDANVVRTRPSVHMLRDLSPHLSIRENKKSKQPYIFYKTEHMSKPQFFSLKGEFRKNYKTCDVSSLLTWIHNTYGV
jgi:DNA topoisomerase-1